MQGQEVITRAQAIERGLRSYFTGIPCKNGHVSPWKLTGKVGICAECRRAATAKYRKTNRDKHNAWSRQNPESRRAAHRRYLERHPERRKKSALAWIDRNRDRHREYQRTLCKRLRQTDPDYRLRCNLRGRLRKAIVRDGALKSGKTLDLIGCTVAQLRIHLELHFDEFMSWDNYGHGPDRWNIDHRIPCASFDLTDSEQQKKCFHFSNLQPMWQLDNIRKGDKIHIDATL